MATVTIGRGAVLLEVNQTAMNTGFDSLLSRLRELEVEMNDINDAAGDMGGELVLAVQDIGAQLQEAGAMLSRWGSSIRGEIQSVVESFGEAGITFQTLRSRFDFEFGSGSDAGWTRALDIASNTLMSTEEVISQAVALHRSGVDALTPMVESRTGDMIPAMEALSDLAATKGERGAFLLERTLQQFFTGDAASAVSHIRTLFDLPANQLALYEQAIEQADTSQERFEAFARVTGELFGGAGRAMGMTWSFQMAQLSDQWAIFRAEVTSGFLDTISPLIGFFADVLRRMREMEAESHTFSRAFAILGAVIEFTVNNVLDPMVDALLWLLEQMPLLIPIGTAIAVAFSGVASFAGFLLSTFGALLPFAVSIAATLAGWATLSAAMSVTFGVIGAVVTTTIMPAVLAVGEAVLGIMAIGGLMTAAWNSDFGHVATVVGRVVLVFRGLYEIMTSINRGVGEMSKETADGLREAGLFDEVIHIAGALYRLGEAAEGAWGGFQEGMMQAWNVIEPLLGNMSGSFSGFFDAFGDNALDANMSLIDRFAMAINSMSPDDWAEIGKQIGSFIADAIVFSSNIYQLVAALSQLMTFLENTAVQWDRLSASMNQALSIAGALASLISPSTMGLVSSVMSPGTPGGGPTTAPVTAPGIVDTVRSFFTPAASAPVQATAPGPTASRGGGGNAIVMLDGRRVGEMLGNVDGRERARVGLNP